MKIVKDSREFRCSQKLSGRKIAVDSFPKVPYLHSVYRDRVVNNAAHYRYLKTLSGLATDPDPFHLDSLCPYRWPWAIGMQSHLDKLFAEFDAS